MRVEQDILGEKQLKKDVYWGIHTQRAMENFVLTGQRVNPRMIKALALVKTAAAEANLQLGYLPSDKAAAIFRASSEINEGLFEDQFPVDALQGGAGAATNMNVNEVIANRATELLGGKKGEYLVDPQNDVNLHQSTNDVYPTALRIAAIQLLLPLSRAMADLQDALQAKETEFAEIIKPGRTQLQDAMPITLGQEFGAYAQAVCRDRGRLYKVEERLRQINLGGGDLGTGLNVPKEYILLVLEKLRNCTSIGLVRAENMIDVTQNADVFVEVSGFLKTAAVNLSKIAADLRLLSSGPVVGMGELILPELQVESVIPGRVNPVIPEAVNQVAFQMMAHDLAITLACQNGQLELNAFLPLVAHHLLLALEIMTRGTRLLTDKCVRGIMADKERCKNQLEKSLVMVPVLLPLLGYEKTAELFKKIRDEEISLRQALLETNFLAAREIDLILDYRELTRPGLRDTQWLTKK